MVSCVNCTFIPIVLLSECSSEVNALISSTKVAFRKFLKRTREYRRLCHDFPVITGWGQRRRFIILNILKMEIRDF